MGAGAESVKAFVKKSRFGVIAGRTAVERTRDVKRRLGRRDGPMGATHRRFDLEGSVAYVESVFADYLEYGELAESDLEGKAVLELGPGDNLGVALCLLAAGAGEVVSTDRFIPFRDPDRELQVLRALVEARGPEARARVGSVVSGGAVDFSGTPFTFLPDTPIENAVDSLGEGRFDLIVSRAVLEHVHDLETAFESMDRLLAPGGTMIHKVDLDDHRLFTVGGQNPLTFLTISDRTYGWMGEESAGLPNRVRLDWYEGKIAELGYESSYRVTHTVGAPGELTPHPLLADWSPTDSDLATVAAMRERMLPRFRGLPDRDLAIAGFMLVARKPDTD
jgi:SAM-dependent methyltransferase